MEIIARASKITKAFVFLLALAGALNLASGAKPAAAATQQQSGSIGLQGTVNGKPPSQAPTISSPSNGQNFTSIPITVTGLCQSGLLVEVFTNNVFAGSTECANGSYSLQIGLFNDRNDLTAKDYDALNQASPVSNKVRVTYSINFPTTGPLLSITSQFAKRGAEPGSTLTWPISISGGTPPYAISVDWGDGTLPEVVSQKVAGNVTIKHIYKTAGTYNVTIQATDANGESAFLQVVGVGNGPIQQSSSKSNSVVVKTQRVIPWWALIILLVLSFVAFWLGKQHQLQTIRVRLRRGQPPFG